MSSRSSNLFLNTSVEMEVEGLQYRRKSSKIALDDLPTFGEKESEAKHEEEGGTYVAFAPDGGYGWVIVFASFFSNFVLDGISLMGGALQLVIRNASLLHDFNISGDAKAGDEYGISVAMYSTVGSTLLSVTLLVGPLISWMTNRFGFRLIGMTGSAVAAFGLFMSWAVSPVTPDIWAMIFFQGFVAGFGFGMMFQPSVVIVGMWFEKWRALATGIAICGTGIGSIVFPIMATYVAAWIGWQGVILVQAAIALLSAVFAFLYRPPPTKFVKSSGVRRPSVTLPIVKADSSGLGVLMKTFTEMIPLLTSPTFLLLAIASGVTMLGFYAPYQFIPDHMIQKMNLDETEAVFAVSFIGVPNTVGRLFFGYLSDRPWMNTLTLNNVALTLGGIATICIPFLTEEYQIYLYVVVFGFMIAIFAVLRSILILEFMGMEKFNNAFGLALLFMGGFTAFGNPIGGYLKDVTKRYDYSFYVAGTYFLVSAIMCYPLRLVSNWERSLTNKGTAAGEKVKSVGNDIEMM